MFDPIRMEFSIVQNVPKHSPKFPVVAVGTEGIPEMFILSDDSFHLLHFDIAKGNEPSINEWQLRGTIPLPRNCMFYTTLGAAEGFLFLHAIPSLKDPPDYCLLDTKTCELKKVCGNHQKRFNRVNAFFGFPQSLSKPCI